MYLGLDVGTSMIKAALFDGAGRECAAAEMRMQLRPAPPGWSELDGATVWRAVLDVIGALFADGRYGARSVRAVGVAGVMVGAWVLDEAGRLLRPPILWNDARAQTLVDALTAADAALYSRIFASSGSIMQLGCTLPVLAWLKANEPETLAKARHVLCAKDYVRFRLTGTIGTDESEAAMAPGSAATRDFADLPMRLLGVEDLAFLLAPVARGETLAGAITPAVAMETGLAAGVPVAVGTGDTPACVLGAGAARPGDAVTVLGTTCLNGVLFDHPVFTPADLGLLFIVPGGRWMKTAVNVAGTTVLDWCLTALTPDVGAGPEPYERLGEIASAAAPGCDGVTFVPYLSASGIIAPRIEPRARAGFSGLAPPHGRAQMVRSVYEGMAYAIRDCYEAVGGAKQGIRLTGGGARSSFWSQMIADVTGCAVTVPEGTQFGAKGAALCAATAVGDFSSIGEAVAATFRPRDSFQPDACVGPAYEDAFARFQLASRATLDVLTAAPPAETA